MAQAYTRLYACQRVITLADLPQDCPCKVEQLNLTADQQLDVLDAACDALAKITGLPVGRCSKVYRPCRDYCRYFDCQCGCGPNGIPLPGIMPRVTAVKINGTTIPSTEYATVRGPGGQVTLERFEADGTVVGWPHWQRIALADTLADTFSITVEAGLFPDAIMKAAAAEIACDIFSQIASERRAPEGAVAASGYGVSVNMRRFGDPTDREAQNLAGLAWLRRFVSANGGSSPAAFYSPELDRGWTMYERV